jgi:hypothetical protein
LAEIGTSSGCSGKPAETVRELFAKVLEMHLKKVNWETIAREISNEDLKNFGINQVSQKPWPSSLQPRGVEIIYDTGEKICFTGVDWLFSPPRALRSFRS